MAAGKEFQKFTKDQAEVARSFGKIAVAAKEPKDKVKELVSAFNEAAKAYNDLTKEQQQSDWGKGLSESLQTLKVRISDAKKELYDFNQETSKNKGTFSQLFSGVAGKFGMSPQMFTGVGAAIAGVGMAAKLAGDNIRTAFNFERSISGLSALTGMVGKDLEKLKNNAIELGSTTTLTASQVADAFRLIGSQQPQLLSDADALKEVTKYAIRLSEAAGIDLATASQTLSTSINQMGGDSANAARYVNVLAAASQKGAGDISWLGEAITKAATAAKAVGADYEELVANLEQLAKAGFDASTAGTALRSIIMNLEKQANNEFKPSVVGLTQAFENLGKAQLDITGYQNIAGKMFATQAKVLAEAAGAAKEMEKSITGTNIAEEQAQTNTANLDGSLKALASAWEGLNLHINDSNGFLKSCVDWLKETVQWMDNTFTAAGRAKKALDDLRGGGEDGKGRKIDTRTEYEVKEVKSAMQGEGDSAKMKQQQILDKYDRDIAAKQKELDRASAQVANAAKSGNYTSVATAQNIEERLRDEVEALKTLKQEFKSASDALITPKQAVPSAKTEIINTEEVEESRRSIKQLQDELKKLKQARDEAADAGNHELVEEYNADIKRIQAEIKAMRGGSTTNKKSATTKELNPMQQAQKEISALTAEALTADEERLEVIKKEIAALQEQVKVYQSIQNYAQGKEPNWKIQVGDRKAFEAEQKKLFEAEAGTPSRLESMQYSVMKEIKAEDIKVDTETLHTLIKDALQNGIDTTSLDLTSIAEQIGKGINVPDEKWQEILDKYNELRAAIGENPIQIDLNTGNVSGGGQNGKGKGEKGIEGMDVSSLNKITSSVSSIASGLQALGVEIPEGFEKTIGVLQLITTLISALQTITAIGAIKPFASGGIVRANDGVFVPGNSYSGDRVPALLNSGEMVLNAFQQEALAGTLQNRYNEHGNESTPYVSGEQIYLGLNNYLRRTGRGELFTAKG